MGGWNVRSLREDDQLSLLSSELKHMDISIAALSEVQRPNSDAWRVVTPTTSLVTLMVTMFKE